MFSSEVEDDTGNQGNMENFHDLESHENSDLGFAQGQEVEEDCEIVEVEPKKKRQKKTPTIKVKMMRTNGIGWTARWKY